MAKRRVKPKKDETSRAKVERRTGDDRRAFPPRPEGRRTGGGRRTKDPRDV